MIADKHELPESLLENALKTAWGSSTMIISPGRRMMGVKE